MIGKMIRSIQIRDAHAAIAEIKTANGAIVCREPNVITIYNFLPRNLEDGADQMPKESTMTENGDAMFGLTFAVAVTSKQIS